MPKLPRQDVFALYGITPEHMRPWNNTPISKLAKSLRENAGYTLLEVAPLLQVKTHSSVIALEQSDDPADIAKVAKAYKPLLAKAVREGWALPDSYAENTQRTQAFTSHWLTLCHLNARKTLSGRVPPTIHGMRAKSSELCAAHHCKDIDALLAIADTIQQAAAQKKAFHQRESHRIRKALGNILEFLDLEPDILTPDIYSNPLSPLAFINGRAYLSLDKMVEIPAVVKAAYFAEHAECKKLPPPIDWPSADDLKRKDVEPADMPYHILEAFIRSGEAVKQRSR